MRISSSKRWQAVRRPMSFVPWYHPNKKLQALEDTWPRNNRYQSEHQYVYTLKRCWLARRCYSAPARPIPRRWPKRCGPTNITGNASIGPGSRFNAKGQTTKIIAAPFRTGGGKLITIAPKEPPTASRRPMKSYRTRA